MKLPESVLTAVWEGYLMDADAIMNRNVSLSKLEGENRGECQKWIAMGLLRGETKRRLQEIAIKNIKVTWQK